MGSMILILVSFVLVVGGTIAYVLYYLRESVWNPAGKGAEKRTSGTLKNFALVRRFKVLSGRTLHVKGEDYPIENMMIGYFGILLVTTCGARGEYYGTLDGDNWSVTLNDKKTTFPNPFKEQEKLIAAMRTLFSANNVYKVPIENLVVLSNRSNKTALYITNSGEILLPRKLKGYLQKSKFEKDAGIDIEQVAALLEQNSDPR